MAHIEIREVKEERVVIEVSRKEASLLKAGLESIYFKTRKDSDFKVLDSVLELSRDFVAKGIIAADYYAVTEEVVREQ